MKPEFKKKLGNIGQKLGYKEIRYGITKSLPFAICYYRNRRQIKYLKSIVEDQNQ